MKLQNKDKKLCQGGRKLAEIHYKKTGEADLKESEKRYLVQQL